MDNKKVKSLTFDNCGFYLLPRRNKQIMCNQKEITKNCPVCNQPECDNKYTMNEDTMTNEIGNCVKCNNPNCDNKYGWKSDEDGTDVYAQLNPDCKCIEESPLTQARNDIRLIMATIQSVLKNLDTIEETTFVIPKNAKQKRKN